MSGVAGRRAALRDGLLFAVAGLLPAIAAVTLGLRAVRNEEAAIRREAAAETEAAAQRAEGSLRGELRDAEARLLAIPAAALPDALGERRRLVASVAPAWSRPALYDARQEPILEGEVVAPAPSVPERSAAACRAAAMVVRKDRAVSVRTLAGCDRARTELGRWLMPIELLGVLGRRADDDAATQLVAWLGHQGALLRSAEQAATREEIVGSHMNDAQKAAALSHLGGVAASSPSAAVAGESARAALRRGAGREGLVRWSGDGALGLVRVTADGSALGFVVDAAAVARALASRADGTAQLRAVEVAPQAGGAPSAIAWLAPGLGVEATLRGGDDLASRTRRSRLGLWAIAGGSAAVALVVAAFLFARVRGARRTSELRTTFAAAVSHELRTPIASIRMLAELLEDDRGGDEDERRETATAIARESRRLGETVSRFLAWSRMSAGQTEVRREEMVLAEVVGDAVDVFVERHPGVEVERALDASVSLAIDAALVQLAVMNLLENARKYAPGGEPYRVVVERSDAGARIAVEDRGPGVPRALRGKIFEAFERGDDRLSRATDGTGIGLALVRAVARAHGGDATVEGGRDGGARFTIVLAGPAG